MAKKPQKENSVGQNNVELELEQQEEELVEVGEEEELEKLEAEVNEMAQRILNYRTTLPDQFKSTLASILAAQRPVIHTHFDSGSESQPGPSSSGPNADAVRPESGNEALLAGDNDDTEKIRLLKDKILSNAETIPIVLKRMEDCMARIDQLESCNEIIHPAFRRKRTS